jgi:hypothetical protein
MDDNESQNSLSTNATSSSACDCNTNSNFSYVQMLSMYNLKQILLYHLNDDFYFVDKGKRFECLAQEKFHNECNWWLDGVDEEKEHETVAIKINDATNTFIGKRKESPIELTTTTPVNRQISRESEASTMSRQSSTNTRPDSEQSYHEEETNGLPKIILTDYQEHNETNDYDDSDSFESGNEEEESEIDADDEIEDEKLPNNSSLRVSRAPSITSQQSKYLTEQFLKLCNFLTLLFPVFHTRNFTIFYQSCLRMRKITFEHLRLEFKII